VSYSAGQANGVVDRIIIEGNRRVASEGLLALIHTHVGDTYNQSALQRDFKTLWDTKNFSDIRIEVRDDPNRANGKIVYFHLVEKPAK
jgi:outer membrane protein assembly factor BamA